MTTDQSSSIVREAAYAFQVVSAGDALAVREFVALLETTPIPAAEAVLLLADLDIHRRRLMRRLRAATLQLQRAPAGDAAKAAA